MIVQFLKSTDYQDRHYPRGDRREFDEETAQALIGGGLAATPESIAAHVSAIAEKPVEINKQKARRK